MPLDTNTAPVPEIGGRPGVSDLRVDDPELRHKAAQLLEAALGPSVEGAQGFMISARILEQTVPAQVNLRSDQTLSVSDVEAIFSTNLTAQAGPAVSHLRVRTVRSNAFDVMVGPPTSLTASEYLKATDPLESDFDLLREALKRPHARIDADYRHASARPVPNFNLIRMVVQTLANRAESHLLLGEPEAAWHDLALVCEACRLLQVRPVTLVSAMVNVAVTGLYTQVLADGLRLRAWREPQLVAIQEQLKHVNLLPEFTSALDAEGAAFRSSVENTAQSDLAKVFSFGVPNTTLWQKLKSPEFLALRCMPRGWLYQNMAAAAARNAEFMAWVDSGHKQVFPQKVDQLPERMKTSLKRSPLLTFHAATALTNYTKALQTLTRNETLANEGFIACALERHRLAHNGYPETLNDLVPRFADQLPQEMVTGSPLQYRRRSATRYLLYSVGWNLKDEGGQPGKAPAEGDWVLRPEP